MSVWKELNDELVLWGGKMKIGLGSLEPEYGVDSEGTTLFHGEP